MKFHNVNRQHRGGEVYRHSMQIDLQSLLDQVMVPRLGEVPQGYQRPLSKPDVREVADLLHGGGDIDGLIRLVLPPKVKIDWNRTNKSLDFELTKENLLEILDGQHRMLGGFLYIEEAGEAARKLPIRVDLYTGMDRIQAAALFHTIHAKQRQVAGRHLAEIAHMAGLEEGEAREASNLLDRLMTGPLAVAEGKQPKIARPAFVKAAAPLMSASGILGKLSVEQRASALEEYFGALGQTIGDEVYKGAVITAACDVYGEVAQRAERVERTGSLKREVLQMAMEPFQGFQLKALEKRGRVSVAEHLKRLVGFQIEGA
jgi:hypothetical protein